jgi:zinc transport system substrate-binding protein
LALLGAVAVPPSAAAEKLPVAASIIPLGDFCRQLGGDRLDVQVLIPPGASPHTFEPTPAAVRKFSRARLVVMVGAHLEPWAARFLQTGARAGVLVEAVAGLDLIQDAEEASPAQHPVTPVRQDGHAHSKAELSRQHQGHDHRHLGGNPHVWLDPVLAQDICRRLAAALIAVDPDHRQLYETNLAAYLSQLESLHQEMAQTIGGFRIKDYVDFHPAFAYLAKRYGLRHAGSIETSPGREPTPRHLRKMVEAVRRSGMRVVFTEPQFDPKIARVIAQEAGVRTLTLDPLGGRPPYGNNYLQLMRHNLAVLQEAMQ